MGRCSGAAILTSSDRGPYLHVYSQLYLDYDDVLTPNIWIFPT